MGDGQADWLSSISEKHLRALQRFVRRLTSDAFLVDEVVQLTLMRAWEHPDIRVRSDLEIRAWLFVVAKNALVDSFRSAFHRHEFDMDELPETPSTDELEQLLTSWLVSDALNDLSQEHRDVLQHFYFQGETTAEISRALGIPEGTVKSRLHYALRSLKAALLARDVVSGS
ncbi:sigma-70 family RNA polymerase sigma factor [Arthrobacter sp. JZ12]|uniref:sigma-70 family RNA polymerase sigma factor n=1 Tax=Arthrobacter sp. JZ12 TaxID=2654190 RepID=UPI002B4A9F69|nr:sigma-70 family RNA polymerase sigma factor [Arthrobacter sp. JZ12]WRH25881.1 sigma-70 family RNA polymerase sigma factor [Arthrobacter sp. JZ12]